MTGGPGMPRSTGAGGALYGAAAAAALAKAKQNGLRIIQKTATNKAPGRQWKGKPRHKFGAVKTIADGIRFDSKAEAAYYEKLKLRQRAGEVVFFLRQTTIHLPGGVRMVLDFTIFEANGTVRFLDVKGFPTRDWINKAKTAMAIYPIKIETAKNTKNGFIEKEL